MAKLANCLSTPFFFSFQILNSHLQILSSHSYTFLSLFFFPSPSSFCINMGCSGSKFDSKAESVPTRLRPLLRRKFEEMRRRKHGLSLKDDGSATLSKKELLKFGVSDDDNSSQPQDVDHKSISSQEDHGLKVVPPPESVETAPKNKMDPNKVVETAPLPPAKPSKDVEHDQKAVEVPSPAGSPKESDESKKQKNIQQDCKDEDKEEGAEVKAVEAMPGVAEMQETKTTGDENGEETEEEEENGRLGSLTQECNCPGSPSFRVFFIESLDNIKEDDGIGKYLQNQKKISAFKGLINLLAILMVTLVLADKDDDDDDDSDKKSQCEVCPSAIESTDNSEAGSETKTKKKAKRRIRLRRVIPKGRPGAVRNLLNVKSCYNPACSGHDNGHLLDEKAVA
ncbi:uncharacterized protein LOC110671860 isoform X1 [Hevea brasiliensis]|uniref:uncharacterized protein LOC110671860 isoform X1 n=1 Tax=Hevea brasiliensis TaxID=3981 RepID=UPI0025D43819|nr:uncharacterized protein LOC110671860 isoform X1 [Hevea brasiliensis]